MYLRVCRKWQREKKIILEKYMVCCEVASGSYFLLFIFPSDKSFGIFFSGYLCSFQENSLFIERLPHGLHRAPYTWANKSPFRQFFCPPWQINVPAWQISVFTWHKLSLRDKYVAFFYVRPNSKLSHPCSWATLLVFVDGPGKPVRNENFQQTTVTQPLKLAGSFFFDR